MKVCPVCKALAFDDAEVCYGCLHDFVEERGTPSTLPDPVSDFFANDDSQPSGGEATASRQEPRFGIGPSGAPTEFVIKFTPLVDPSGAVAWNCVVES